MKLAFEGSNNVEGFLRNLVKQQAQLNIETDEKVPLGFKILKLHQSLQQLFVDTSAHIEQEDQQTFNKKVTLLSKTNISKLYLEGDFIYKQPLILDDKSEDEKFIQLLNNTFECQITRWLDFLQLIQTPLNKELLHFNTQGVLVDHLFVREKFYVLNEITDATKFDFAILKILKYFNSLNAWNNLHHGDIKPENIFLSHDQHDRFLFVTTDSGSLIQLDKNDKLKKYQPSTYTPLYSTQKYQDSVNNGIPLTYDELMEEDKHQLFLTLQKQATRFKPTDFTKLVLSLFPNHSTIEEIYQIVILDHSISLQFAQLHLVDPKLSANQAFGQWQYFKRSLEPWIRTKKDITRRSKEVTDIVKLFVDCHYEDMCNGGISLTEDILEQLDDPFRISLEMLKRLGKVDDYFKESYAWRPKGVLLKRVIENRDIAKAQEALRLMATISKQQVHLRKLLRSFPYLIEQELNKVKEEIQDKEKLRLLLIQLYIYGVELVSEDEAKSYMQEQLHAYLISFLNRPSIPTSEELSGSSYILDSNNFPSELITNLEFEKDFMIRVRSTTGCIIYTTYKIIRVYIKRGQQFFQDFLELIERYQIQHIVHDAEAMTFKDQLNNTSEHMVKEYLHFVRMKNVHAKSMWKPEQINDLLFLHGPIWTIQSLTSSENAAQHIYHSHLSLVYDQQQRVRNCVDLRHKEYIFLKSDQAILNYILYTPRITDQPEQCELVLLYLLNQLLYDVMIDQKAYIEPFENIDKIEVSKDKQGRILSVKPKANYVVVEKEAAYGKQGQELSTDQLLSLQQDHFCQFALSLNREQFSPILRGYLEAFIKDHSSDSLDMDQLQTLLYQIRCDSQICLELTQKYREQSDPQWNSSSNLWHFFTGCFRKRDFALLFKTLPKQIPQPPAFKHYKNEILLPYFMDSFNHVFAGDNYENIKVEGYFPSIHKFSIETKFQQYQDFDSEESDLQDAKQDFAQMKGYITKIARLSNKQLFLKRLVFDGIIEQIVLMDEPVLRGEVIGLMEYAIGQVEGCDREGMMKELEDMKVALMTK
ncbi:hypothetical protein FGO68_gene16054 [Halteria grandinella]|uniref:Uncharacterized protein n=1 Tax=Halteria grandinella TaxID=5974 RepID=A0A8J8T8J1_HALGN|nr:hypothetical protein FGO68_gene16054 [Halteria grandinella]